MKASASASKHNTEILIVEGDEFLRHILDIKFNNEGYIVRTAATGEEALARITDSVPAIMLIDIYLPKLSGLEVLSEIQSWKTAQDMAIVVISNMESTEDADRAKRLGATTWLVKSESSIHDITKAVKEAYTKRKNEHTE